MNHTDEKINSAEDELPEVYTPTGIPAIIKIFVAAASLPIFIISICLYAAYIDSPTTAASPISLGLPTLLVVTISSLLIVFLPWERLGVRIRKIGPIEFGDIIKTQITERDKSLSELDDRIEKLEDELSGMDEGKVVSEMLYGPELRRLLSGFLHENGPTAYSPTRIQFIAKQQTKYEKLAQYDPMLIRRTLRKLVAEDIVTTTISRQGNTLYRLKTE